MTESIARLFRQFSDTHQIFDRLTPEQKTRLIAISSVRKFENRQQIATLCDPVDGIYFIVEGGIRLENISESGDRFLSGDLMAGDVFGFLSVLDGQPSIHDATSNGETTVVFVPANRFRNFIYSDPQLSRTTTMIMCQRLRMSLATFNRFAPGSLTARVARCLMSSIDQVGFREETGKRTQVLINQYDLAAMLSISRQSVHRVLKDLEMRGILKVGYNAIDVYDIAKLRSLQ